MGLLASYDLLSPSTVSTMGMSSALGHMTIPNLVGFAIHNSGFGYDALIWIALMANAVGLALLSAVVFHLQQNFRPNADSVLGRRRWHRQQQALRHLQEE